MMHFNDSLKQAELGGSRNTFICVACITAGSFSGPFTTR